MTTEDKLFEEIAECERQKEDRITRLLGYKVFINSTDEVKKVVSIPDGLTEKIFKPSFFYKTTLTSIFLSFVVIILFTIFRDWNRQTPWEILFAFLFSAMILNLILQELFIDKEYNYTIRLTLDGLNIKGMCFLWKDIFATAIMRKPSGKAYDNFLVIVLNDQNTYEIFRLKNFISTDFLGFSTKLSAYIEYFKKNPIRN